VPKKYVVLDLFIIHAITSNDLNLYFSAGGILHIIEQKCHKIVLIPSLKKEYNTRLKSLEKEGRESFANDRLFKYIKRILINSEKVAYEDSEPSFELKVNIPQDDLPIIKAALMKGGNTVIITTNRKHFIENDEIKKFLEDKGIKVLSPKEAIIELSKD